MSFISKLFENPAIQEKAFGMIKNMMKENGVQYFILSLKPDDEFDIQMLKEENKPVVFSQDTVNEMAATYDESVELVARQQKMLDMFNSQGRDEELKRVVQIAEEQEQTIVRATSQNAELVLEVAAKDNILAELRDTITTLEEIISGYRSYLPEETIKKIESNGNRH